MIEVKNLTKYYGERPAIANVSFKVNKGEILGLLGPNGAGKTTTMRILTGYMPPDEGTATVAGFDVVKQSLDVRRRIGYLPETVPLYTDMSVREYLDFVAKIRGVRRDQREARVDEVLALTRTEDVEDRLISKISRGYRQRVGIAQALVHDPDVLILDEPTVGLDPRQVSDTRKLIKQLGGTRSIILSTHILPEVSMTCNRVVIISEGQVVAVDTPENLKRRLQGSERLQLQVRGPATKVVTTLRQMPQVMHVETQGRNGEVGTYAIDCAIGADVREALARTIVNNSWGLLELRPYGMSLEEVFIKLTTKEEPIEA